MTLALVQLGRGFGPVGTVEPPESIETPVISAVADTDSITVTIAGEAGATHHVLHKLASSATWVTGNSRTNDGDVVISGLAVGSYHILAYSVLAGVVSGPSQMVTAAADGVAQTVAHVLDGDGTAGNALRRGATAMQDRLRRTASMAIDYIRGERRFIARAVVGSSTLETADADGFSVAAGAVDFLVDKRYLLDGGVQLLPKPGDRIESDIGDFVVQTLPGGRCWRDSDAWGRVFRIHAKKVFNS